MCVCFGIRSSRNIIFIQLGTLYLWGDGITITSIILFTLLDYRLVPSDMYVDKHAGWCRGLDHTCMRATTILHNYNINGVYVYTH